MLHAHTPFEVTVQVCPGGVYVQVWDDDPVLPTRRVSGLTSTTGRGLELLEAVATASGVQAVGPNKVVWFSLGDTGPDTVRTSCSTATATRRRTPATSPPVRS